MNAPQLYERFKVPQGRKKVEMVADTKVQNAATFTMLGEEHTIGNVVRMELIADENVLFVGYQIPHPLMHEMKVRIHTTGKDRKTGRAYSPEDALLNSLENLQNELAYLDQEFTRAVDKALSDRIIFGGAM